MSVDRQQSSVSRRWQSIALALACFIIAQASLAFAIPPGFASPLAPAAGVALAALAIWGTHHWPAVWLASSAAHLYHQAVVEGNGATPELVAVSALIATGAAAQAALGARLVRPYVESTGLFTRERHTFVCLVLGGPLACLASAAIGVTALYLLNGLPEHALAAHWITWWAGDSLGVVLFAPLAMLVLPQSRQWWRGSALQIAVPLIITMVLIVSGWRWLNLAEETVQHERTALAADDVAFHVRTALTRQVASAQALAALFDASERVSRAEFSTFGRSTLRWSDLRELAWIPRVASAQRGLP